eukprot:4645167-Amphidinium_carterae.1
MPAALLTDFQFRDNIAFSPLCHEEGISLRVTTYAALGMPSSHHFEILKKSTALASTSQETAL